MNILRLYSSRAILKMSMVLRLNLLVVLSLIALSSAAQVIDCEWKKNELVENQIVKFANGESWIKNLLIGDTIWRYEYTKSGDLKIKAQVSQLVYCDTLITFDFDTYEEYFELSYYRKDIPNGAFVKYHANGKIKEEGFFLEGHRFGKWKEYFISGQLKKEINYNKRGKREGIYSDYFASGKVKTKGQYEIKKIIKEKIWFDSETYEEFKGESIFEYEVKKGEWQYFSRSGRFPTIVIYN